MNGWITVILAAGQGKRMKSSLPKVLHPLAGQPMISYVLDAASRAGPGRRIVVIGNGADQVRQTLEGIEDTRFIGKDLEYVLQKEQLGTGHALLQVMPLITHAPDQILVLNGDIPLITPDTLSSLVDSHQRSNAAVTFLSCITDQPKGLGRVMRDINASVRKIVEEAALRPGRGDLAPTGQAPEGSTEGAAEVNAGVYCFDGKWLWSNIGKLQVSTVGEYYLTDMIELATSQGCKVETVVCKDLGEAIGVNDRVQLAQAEAVIRSRIAVRLMLEGVTLVDPSNTYIDAGVEIGQDTVVYPNTTIRGRTKIGAECKIGPNSIITDSQIGDHCHILSSVIEESILEEEVEVGPFSHLRPESYIGARTHIGNFGEIKKSKLGQDVKMGHFSYIGDAQVGNNVNIGAGAITCNFDGVDKLPTTIGDDAFIGCDTMLVAPVTVGAGAVTGAGAVVTEDIPPDSLAVGVPAKVIKTGLNKKGTTEERRA